MSKSQTKRDVIVAAYERLGGNNSAVSRELGIPLSTVRFHVRKAGADKKPIVGGTVLGVAAAPMFIPAPGQVARYIITSAQNNTKIHEKLWTNLLALAEHYKAKILVGTYSYNKNAYGALSVKRGTKGEADRELWYDERLAPYLSDERVDLGQGLVWCGEMNILPTAIDPLEGLETYSGRKSAIFPHAKIAMRSIPTMMNEGTKLNYTSGTVTLRNYLQKKAGLVAEHHHSYGALIVEVNSVGNWWVRQLDADNKGNLQDLDLVVEGGVVREGERVEAITWGDMHSACIDPEVAKTALGPGGLLDTLRPKYQFLHDIMEGVSVNHHAANNPHEKYKAFLRGFSSVECELRITAGVIKAYARPWVQTLVVDSNHDSQWLYLWLREHDYRRDPLNAELFLDMQLQVYKNLRENRKFHITEWCMRRHNIPENYRFLGTDESFTLCNKKIECGMHGHLGPNGARGNAKNLTKIGRRANIGHVHSAGIYDGLFAAGTSCSLDMGYNKGPSSWTHTHIVTYPNGKRTLITIFAGKWRA